jgi:UrcA family protein
MNCMKTFPTRVLMTTILAAASYATHAVSAYEHGRVAVTVRYDDLNLSAPAGVNTLKRRVSSAAAQVCADKYGSDPIGRVLTESCVHRTTKRALAQVKWPEK